MNEIRLTRRETVGFYVMAMFAGSDCSGLFLDGVCMKTIIEMAREAGLVRAGDGWTEPARWGLTEIDLFATLVKAARDAELLAGVEMPEAHQLFTERCGHFVVTADQMRETVAAAVAKTNAAWQVVNQVREEETDELRAELAQRDAHIVEYNTRIQAEVLKLLNEKDALKAENERLLEVCNKFSEAEMLMKGQP